MSPTHSGTGRTELPHWSSLTLTGLQSPGLPLEPQEGTPPQVGISTTVGGQRVGGGGGGQNGLGKATKTCEGGTHYVIGTV